VAGRRRITREAILAEATAIVVGEGIASLTFQALADRLGVTKQAIIYWYPTKQDLARDLVLPTLRAEAQAAIEAVAGAQTAPDAIAAFVRALVDHHLKDLRHFRYAYLSSQLDPNAPQIMDGIGAEIYATTSAMYGALEAKLAADAEFDAGQSARRAAVAVHMATIGLTTMVAMAEAVDDPLAHTTDALVGSLVGLLTGGRGKHVLPKPPGLG
jgi:AcrR family transcriptional regulator